MRKKETWEEEFVARIKYEMSIQHITREELAKAAGIALVTLKDHLAHLDKVGAVELFRILDFLKIDREYVKDIYPV